MFFLHDVRVDVGAVESLDEFNRRSFFHGHPSVYWVDKVWEKLGDICGEFSDKVVFSELFFTDFVGFLLCGVFIKESKAVDVFVKEDVEDVGLEEFWVGFRDASERCSVDDDDVGGDWVVGADESLE